ncbi:serine hydrolase domain-containing protein [Niallia sp. Man26]|uniref:serine hydrolase domain-containing protein n=1 Tax=Niallia sp. Man26 TaxID=2912824 RepID=UPI001EDAA26B|nr:serine hydrolase domain-containing protein [Niallia sp. Man26]UPO90751.1 beta-lactamase family protein [Niallia sp. Man26]
MRKKNIIVLAIMLLFLTPLSVSANNEDIKQLLESYVGESLGTYNIPGASLKIIKNGETFYQGNWGVMSDETRVTSDTPFLIGSLSKPITSLAILMLVEDGKIKLDETLTTYIPSFKYKTISPKEIKVLHLLKQTSGISQFDSLKITDIDTKDKDALTKAVGELNGVELSNEPGTVYEYNSVNYLLLGSIIEEVTNQTFSEFINKNIFAPLGMNHSAADYESAVDKGYVPGFKSWFGKPIKSKELYDNAGAPYGYMVSSTNDLAKFLTFMQKGGELLSDENLQILKTPPEEEGTYGLGWHFSKEEKFPFHGGATPDYRAEMFYMDEKDYAVVLLTNKYHIMEDAQVFYIMDGIRSIMNGAEPLELQESSNTIQWIALGLILLLTVLTIFHIFLLRKRKRKNSKWSYTYGSLLIILAIGIIPIVIYAMDSPWKSIRLFAPDIAFLINILVVIFCINGVSPILFNKLPKLNKYEEM